MIDTPFVTDERKGGVVHVRLNRPDRHNALLPEMWRRLAELGAELVADRAVRCVVVSGEGESFCSGLDRRAAAENGFAPAAVTGDPADRGRTEWRDADIAAAQAVGRWLHDGDFVSIAAVRGWALGAGAQLTFAADLRIVGADATFALPEVTLGLFPEMTAVALLPGIIGYNRAMEMALSARRVDAAEAERLGLATRLVEPDRAVPEAVALAGQIAALPVPAIRHCKRAMKLGAAGRVEESLAVARQGGLQLLEALAERLRDAR